MGNSKSPSALAQKLRERIALGFEQLELELRKREFESEIAGKQIEIEDKLRQIEEELDSERDLLDFEIGSDEIEDCKERFIGRAICEWYKWSAGVSYRVHFTDFRNSLVRFVDKYWQLLVELERLCGDTTIYWTLGKCVVEIARGDGMSFSVDSDLYAWNDYEQADKLLKAFERHVKSFNVQMARLFPRD